MLLQVSTEECRDLHRQTLGPIGPWPRPIRGTPANCGVVGNPDPSNHMSPPPYTVHPLPFHAASQPDGLECLERWVGTCHKEIQWQLRNRAVEPPEAPHPQREWLALGEAVASPTTHGTPTGPDATTTPILGPSP